MGLKRTCEDGTTLHIIIEDDATHYKERKAGPGMDRVMPKVT